MVYISLICAYSFSWGLGYSQGARRRAPWQRGLHIAKTPKEGRNNVTASGSALGAHLRGIRFMVPRRHIQPLYGAVPYIIIIGFSLCLSMKV